VGKNPRRLPGSEGYVGGTAKDNRLFIEAVLYRYRAGIPWRDLPERFGDYRNVHKRLSRWSESGVWERIFQILIADADNEYVMIDSTIVRAHQHSAGAQKNNGTPPAIGRSQGGLTTKIHALGDALGNPIGFHRTGGQAHDLEGADVLIEMVEAKAWLADRADDAMLGSSIGFKKNHVNPLFRLNLTVSYNVLMINFFTKRDLLLKIFLLNSSNIVLSLLAMIKLLGIFWGLYT
jgi:transposase